ncbi:N-methyl-L-tryptophan oxidase [Halobellus marinus]|uniref:N-methyl-L-tryptophan oxidase n=1 Tax=Halobellus TaxID=1073986 RepID=UPI0028A6F8B3|nr:N-methyl-L-tryptophan oxidase [Halobellus sp. DFY28]
MSDYYDVIVIGVGGMGSAAAYHLADRGIDTLALERYDIPHGMGSSHGVTRIIRRAPSEDPAYLPLVERAYENWRELESETGRDLLHITGGIDAGPADSTVFTGSRQSCEEHDIDHEILTGDEVNERFPGYGIPEDHRAVYQPESGFLVPEQGIIAHVEAARAAGAEIRAREPVEDFTTQSDGDIRVSTSRETYEADKLVITAGAWTSEFLPEFGAYAVPVRQALAWFGTSDPDLFAPDNFPVFVHGTEEDHFYGFPEHDVPGFKLGKFNHFGNAVDPDEMDRTPNQDDEDLLRSYAEDTFPEGAGPTMQLATCLFTNTPDNHFIVDTLPDRSDITVGAGFSGHGFKYASAIGEILASLAISGETDLDIGLFGADRFD